MNINEIMVGYLELQNGSQLNFPKEKNTVYDDI